MEVEEGTSLELALQLPPSWPLKPAHIDPRNKVCCESCACAMPVDKLHDSLLLLGRHRQAASVTCLGACPADVAPTWQHTRLALNLALELKPGHEPRKPPPGPQSACCPVLHP